MTNNVRSTTSVGDSGHHTGALQLVLSKKNIIGDTVYNIQCTSSLGAWSASLVVGLSNFENLQTLDN